MILKKKADLELDQIGKIILLGIALIILITIISVYISGELDVQAQRIQSIFNIF